MTHHRTQSTYDARIDMLARGLGWFSLGLGAVEVLAPEKLDRLLGTDDYEMTTRFYGFREIAAGLGILLSEDPTPWVWARAAGDALDLASLTPALESENPQRGSLPPHSRMSPSSRRSTSFVPSH